MVRYGENNKCSQEINESGKRRKSVYRYMNRTLVAKKKEETVRERERESSRSENWRERQSDVVGKGEWTRWRRVENKKRRWKEMDDRRYEWDR